MPAMGFTPASRRISPFAVRQGGGTARDPGMPTAPPNLPPPSQNLLGPVSTGLPGGVNTTGGGQPRPGIGFTPEGTSRLPTPAPRTPASETIRQATQGPGAPGGALDQARQVVAASLPGVGTGAQGSQAPYAGDPFTGDAGRYMPGSSGTIFNTPGLVLQDALRSMGIQDPLNSGLYYMLEPYADVINEMLLMQHGGPGGGGISPESAINYFDDAFTQLGTQGGRAPSFNSLFGNVMEAGQPGVESDLGYFLNVADPTQQVRNLMTLGRAAGSVGLHPLFADAFNARMAVAGNDFLNQQVKGDYTGNAAQFMGENYAPDWMNF